MQGAEALWLAMLILSFGTLLPFEDLSLHARSLLDFTVTSQSHKAPRTGGEAKSRGSSSGGNTNHRRSMTRGCRNAALGAGKSWFGELGRAGWGSRELQRE